MVGDSVVGLSLAGVEDLMVILTWFLWLWGEGGSEKLFGKLYQVSGHEG